LTVDYGRGRSIVIRGSSIVMRSYFFGKPHRLYTFDKPQAGHKSNDDCKDISEISMPFDPIEVSKG